MSFRWKYLACFILAALLISGCVTDPSKRYNGPGSPTIHFGGEGDGGSGDSGGDGGGGETGGGDQGGDI
ncbi:MAG: hypothetical protein C0622_06345 [Desulfuromonas sp.]|nr:MAG: hypothetical protein C0622_06345 [Desulfuromonas sp.]